MWALFSLCFFLPPVAGEYVPMTTFPWSPSGCASGYDFCGELVFCTQPDGLFGYDFGAGCSSPGPLIRMTPGNRYYMALQHDSAEADPSNLHTHGLYIWGDGNGDDITRTASYGECLSYNWDIPVDHYGGTNWYHAHRHSSVDRQVGAGAHGMIIIEDNYNTLFPNSLTSGEQTSIQAFLQNEINLQIHKLEAGSSNYRVNGVEGTNTVTLVTGEWYRFRISLFRSLATLEPLVVGGNCEFRTVARDGIFRSTVPGPLLRSLLLSGASRIDLAVRCTGSGSLSYSVFDALNIVTTPGARSDASPFAADGRTWDPVRPAYLTDLIGQPTADFLVRDLTVSSRGVSQDGSNNPRKWDKDVPNLSYPYGSKLEWTIKSSIHPLHVHIFHMQVVTPGGCGSFEEGEWYDTIADSGCTVRLSIDNFAGRVVLHCHILAHEDGGAMGWLDITGGPLPPTSNPDVGSRVCSDTPQCEGCEPIAECGTDVVGTDSCSASCIVAGDVSCPSSSDICSNGACVPDCGDCTPTAECGTDIVGTDGCGVSCIVADVSCPSSSDICSNGGCVPAPSPSTCVVDGFCRGSENLANCPEDCDGGRLNNNVCEGGNGENTDNSADCNGISGGKKGDRWFCGAGYDCQGSSGSSTCFTDGNTCTMERLYCGDGVQSPGETACNCEHDFSAPCSP